MNYFTKKLCHSQFQGSELYHHGILGMHWGIRRYQPYGHGGYNPDHSGKNIGEAKRLGGDARKVDKKQKKFVKILSKKNGVSKLANNKSFRQTINNQENKRLQDARKDAATAKAISNAALGRMFSGGKFDPNRKAEINAYGKTHDTYDSLYDTSINELSKANKILADELFGKYSDVPIKRLNGKSAASSIDDILKELYARR